ncbi:MAG: HAD family hydrolase [Candidatus Njordarchaeia archaeon]
MLKAVIFDVDGTLVDTLETMARAAKNIGERLNLKGNFKNLKFLVGMKPEDIIEVIFDVHEADKIQLIKKEWSEEALRLVVDRGEAKLFPKVIETLQWIKEKGLKIGVGSSLLSHMIKKIGEAYGFLKYVDAYVGSDEVKNGKPDPETFLRVAEKLHVDPSHAIVVGDTHFDIIAGHKGGFKTILFDPVDRYKDEKMEVEPDYKIKTYDELKKIISSLI